MLTHVTAQVEDSRGAPLGPTVVCSSTLWVECKVRRAAQGGEGALGETGGMVWARSR